MKRILASLLVLAMCAPAMAISFTTADGGNGNLVINYTLTSAETLRGMALVLNVTDGDAAVAASTDCTVAPFNTFVDFAADVDNTYTAVGQGHPFALVTPDVVNNQYEAAFPATSFALSLGYLDNDDLTVKGEGIKDSGSITVKFTKGATNTATVSIALDSIRGGVVGDALVAATGLPTSQLLTFTVPSCRDKFTGEQLAQYDRYVGFGKTPTIWCAQFQCWGDADNAEEYVFDEDKYFQIYDGDLTIFLANWKKTTELADPAADFDHNEEYVFDEDMYFAVYDADLTILLANWKKEAAQLTACDSYMP